MSKVLRTGSAVPPPPGGGKAPSSAAPPAVRAVGPAFTLGQPRGPPHPRCPRTPAPEAMALPGPLLGCKSPRKLLRKRGNASSGDVGLGTVAKAGPGLALGAWEVATRRAGRPRRVPARRPGRCLTPRRRRRPENPTRTLDSVLTNTRPAGHSRGLGVRLTLLPPQSRAGPSRPWSSRAGGPREAVGSSLRASGR